MKAKYKNKKYKKGGKLKLDFNNDGKVTRGDFIYKAVQNKKNKK